MPSSSPEANLFLLFIGRFDELQVPYMVSGSVAAMIYGEARLTNDVDLVVLLNERNAARAAPFRLAARGSNRTFSHHAETDPEIFGL
jgi:hypothetical protein